MSVTNTYTVGDSRPLCLFGNIPLTIVSQTKSVWGLTIQILSPSVNYIICFCFFFLVLYFDNSIDSLSLTNSLFAVVNFGNWLMLVCKLIWFMSTYWKKIEVL